MEKFIKKIKDKKDLTFEESRSAFEFLMEGNAKEEEIYDFLTFLSKKERHPVKLPGEYLF